MHHAGGDDARFSLVLPRDEARSEIHVGPRLAERLGALLRDYAPAHAYAVIADDTVARLHGRSLVAALSADGLDARLHTFPAGEANKTPTTWARLVEALAADGLGRDACVVGLGGGVTTDLAGFVAATFLRGVPLVQVPTTLLAMVDAAIGGKSGVDLDAGKNLAGSFWQPRLVVADPAFLATLPESELRAGLAEVVKHGAIADAAGFEWLASNGARVLGGDPDGLRRVVEDSVRVKTAFVAQDVFEGGARAMLNFGHTIAHALERVTAYGLAHGPAVAIGMVVEAGLGESVGATAPGTADRIREAVSSLGLPSSIPPNADPRAVLEATRTDKKARAGAVRYSLIREVGAAARPADGGWTWQVADDALLAVLAEG